MSETEVPEPSALVLRHPESQRDTESLSSIFEVGKKRDLPTQEIENGEFKGKTLEVPEADSPAQESRDCLALRTRAFPISAIGPTLGCFCRTWV